MSATIKTLVVIMGNSRGGTLAWKSMISNLIKPFNADLALVMGEGEEDNLLYKTCKFVKTVPEYEDWGECIDLIQKDSNIIDHDWRKNMIHEKTLKSGLWGGMKYNNQTLSCSGAIIFCFRYFVKKMIEENNLLEKYDRFIITRSDHYYDYEHRIDLDNSFTWIPQGEDYGGVTDRHIILNNKNVIKSLEVISWCLEKSKKNIKMTENPEHTLKTFYTDIGLFTNIKRYERSFFTIKRDTDMSRWGKSNRYIKRLGVYTKYDREYVSTIENKAKLLELNKVLVRTIELESIPYYYLCNHNVKRRAHLEQQFKNYRLIEVNPNKDMSNKISSMITGFSRILDLASQNQPRDEFEPFVILEDDVTKTRDFPNNISVPLNADIVYIGLSTWGMINYDKNIGSNNSVVCTNYNSDLIKIYNMLSCHGMIICSIRGLLSIQKALFEAFYSGIIHDVFIAQIQPFLNVYALKKPFLYQTQSLGGQQESTQISSENFDIKKELPLDFKSNRNLLSFKTIVN